MYHIFLFFDGGVGASAMGTMVSPGLTQTSWQKQALAHALIRLI